MPELGRPACDRHQTRSTFEWTTLKPLDNPLGTRLSPMSQVRSDTYVSGLDMGKVVAGEGLEPPTRTFRLWLSSNLTLRVSMTELARQQTDAQTTAAASSQ